MKLRYFSFYHRETGEFSTQGFSTSDHRAEHAATLNAPPDHLVIEGQFDPSVHHVDISTRAVVRWIKQ